MNSIPNINSRVPVVAQNVIYNNTTSGLQATNVQDAIDEVAQGGGGGSISGIDLIWSNPDDTQAQTSGTLATLSDQPTYKAFMVIIKEYKSSATYFSVNAISALKAKSFTGDGSGTSSRLFTITQSGSLITIAAEEGDTSNYGQTYTINNDVNIISQVYGIK